MDGPLPRAVLLGLAGLLIAHHHQLDDGGGAGLTSAGEETGRQMLTVSPSNTSVKRIH
jgi:hypothetical protein